MVIWHTQQFMVEVNAIVIMRLEKAAGLLQQAIKINISRESTKKLPSAPGDFPHAVKGTLRDSIAVEMDVKNLVARVGTNVFYGKYLEFGVAGGREIVPTKKRALSWIGPDGRRHTMSKVIQGPIKAKRYMWRSLQQVWPQIQQIMAA